MAGSMSRFPTLRSAGALLLLCMLPLVAWALPDPTQPPGGLTTVPGQAAAAEERGLQSVIIAPGRRAAIINGHTVELGEKYGDARLVEVSERGVVLRGKQGKQVMQLFPGVEMKKRVAPRSLSAKPVSASKAAGQKAAASAVPREGK